MDDSKESHSLQELSQLLPETHLTTFFFFLQVETTSLLLLSYFSHATSLATVLGVGGLHDQSKPPPEFMSISLDVSVPSGVGQEQWVVHQQRKK